MKFLLAIFLCFLPSCNNAPTKVQIAWPKHNNANDYEFINVELPNLKDLRSLNGKNFSFKGSQNFYGIEAYSKISNFNSFENMHSTSRNDIFSKPISLDVEAIGDTYVANTFESLLMLTAYYAFEDIRQKAKTYLKIDSKAFSEFMSIGVYPLWLNSKSYPKPLMTNDNAMYSSLLDNIFILGVGDMSGLPFALNIGVFAHEYFHRIFHKQVWQNSNYNLWPLFKSSILKEYETSKEKQSNFYLSATDEGLADLFAVAYTANPSFMSVSLTGKNEQILKEQRSLTDQFARIATYENLNEGDIDKKWLKYCDKNYYCLGTVLAKTFYMAAQNDISILRNEILPLIPYGLEAISENFSKRRFYTFAILLNAIVKKAPPGLKSNLCQAYDEKFHSLMGQIACP